MKRDLQLVALLLYGIWVGGFIGYTQGSRSGYRSASEDDAIDLRSCRLKQADLTSRLDEARSSVEACASAVGACIDACLRALDPGAP